MLPIFSIFLFSLIPLKASETNEDIFIEWPEFLISGISEKIEIHQKPSDDISLFVNGKELELTCEDNSCFTLINITQHTDLKIYNNNNLIAKKSFIPIPAWMSLLPPLLAIVLALVFREVIISLFLGIFIGTLIPGLYTGGFSNILPAFFKIIDHYAVNAIFDKAHISVILFSMLIGATVNLISKNGGMSGVVNRLSKYARNRRTGQLVTWFLGIAIFFDDYANTLIVGNTMRPITDKLKISREKLSYIVDSTAAPVAAIAFVTTWIGAELGYLQDGVNAIAGLEMSVYQIFLNSLQYSFYPIFTLIFIFMLVWMKRDFGPMYSAEIHAINSKESPGLISISENEMRDFEPDAGIKIRPFNAVLPILTIIVVTVWALLHTGWDEAVWSDNSKSFLMKLSDTIGRGDPYKALLWASLSGLILAAFLSLSQRILGIQAVVNSMIQGFKTMLTAMIILVLAWSLSEVTVDLHTADYLTNSISGNFSPYALPLTTFILAALVSFSTGSSWGTMAILYPMMMPLSWSVCMAEGMELESTLLIFFNVISCVLAGSVLGDHCSPISDTTILSSLASSCNHIEHVRSQMPYAITVGLISLVIGTVPATFGIPFLICLPMGVLVMYLVIRRFGKETS